MPGSGELGKEGSSTDDSSKLACRRVVLKRQRASYVLIGLAFCFLLTGLVVLGLFVGTLGFGLCAGVALILFRRAARIGSKSVDGGSVDLATDSLRVVDGNGHTLNISLDDVVSGYSVATENTVVLTLRSGRELQLALQSDAPSRVLVHARVALTQRVLSVPLRRTLGAFTIGFVAFWTSLVGAAIAANSVPWEMGWPEGPFLIVGVAALATTLAVFRFGFPRVTVGTDGLRVRGGLGTRFASYAEIQEVTLMHHTGPSGIQVRLRDGKDFPVPTIAAPAERIQGLFHRIQEALQLHAGGGVDPVHVLARGGRSTETWKDDLSRAALAPGGFRARSLEREDFERVLDDASASPDQRIGAALALRAVSPEAPARIRVAADASADEALRAALTLAAEGEVDEAMLDRVEAARRR